MICWSMTICEVINSKENGADRNIQLIIETHSEHFFRRLQRRNAEDTIPQENWWGWKDALADVGITVHFLCPDYVRSKYEDKMGT